MEKVSWEWGPWRLKQGLFESNTDAIIRKNKGRKGNVGRMSTCRAVVLRLWLLDCQGQGFLLEESHRQVRITLLWSVHNDQSLWEAWRRCDFTMNVFMARITTHNPDSIRSTTVKVRCRRIDTLGVHKPMSNLIGRQMVNRHASCLILVNDKRWVSLYIKFFF